MIDLPCPAADWPRFTALLDAALDQPESGREAWLAGLEGEDARLRPALARLFGGAAGPETGQLLGPAELPPDSDFHAGDRIGPYRLEARLGEGGMGEVWHASRAEDGPRRDVALKLPHAGWSGGASPQRFARERDMLAALSHPNIAQLYESGTGAGGHPFLALELVRGRPITGVLPGDAAPDQALLVDLARQMLSALIYAHRRLIVHRDIKPANVLVDEHGVVKVLDFGIAKLLGAEAEADPALTGPMRLATPAYAAPEQLRGEPITVAADVFSAGVLLFELCTGARPFERVPVQPWAPAAARASDSVAEAAGGGDLRRRQLRGDLDAIIGRAISLDPAQRYPSAEAFDDDLGRWRAGLPVRARRLSWVGQAGKFARRNRLGVALACGLFVSLLGGTAGIAWQAHRAAQEAARAGQEAARADAVRDFLIGVFEASDPRAGAKRSDLMTARDLLDLGVTRSETAFTGDPATRMALLRILSDLMSAVGDNPRSLHLAELGYAAARASLPPGDPRVLNAGFAYSDGLARALMPERAKAVLDELRPPILDRYGADSLFEARWLTFRTYALRAQHGAFAEIVADAEAACRIFATSALGREETQDYINVLMTLANRQSEADEFALSLATIRRARAVEEAAGNGVAGSAPVSNALALLQLSFAEALRIGKLGDTATADRMLAEVQAQSERRVGTHSDWYIFSVLKRAEMAELRGDRARAEMLFRLVGAGEAGAGAILRRAYETAMVREGRGAAMIPALEKTLAETRGRPSEENIVRRMEGVLGEAYDQADRAAEARAMLLAARDEWAAYGVAGAAATLSAENQWGSFLLRHGEAAAAASQFRKVVAQAGAIGGIQVGASQVGGAQVALAQAGLARVALAAGNLAEADAESRQALDRLAGVTVEYDVRARIELWSARAEILLAMGQKAAAADWAGRAMRAADDDCAPGSPLPGRMRDLVARIAGEAPPR